MLLLLLTFFSIPQEIPISTCTPKYSAFPAALTERSPAPYMFSCAHTHSPVVRALPVHPSSPWPSVRSMRADVFNSACSPSPWTAAYGLSVQMLCCGPWTQSRPRPAHRNWGPPPGSPLCCLIWAPAVRVLALHMFTLSSCHSRVGSAWGHSITLPTSRLPSGGGSLLGRPWEGREIIMPFLFQQGGPAYFWFLEFGTRWVPPYQDWGW